MDVKQEEAWHRPRQLTRATTPSCLPTSASHGRQGAVHASTHGNYGRPFGCAKSSAGRGDARQVLGWTDIGVIGPTAFYSNAPVRVSAVGGEFTGGKVRLVLYAFALSAPTP